jgi:hypothetical protein
MQGVVRVIATRLLSYTHFFRHYQIALFSFV